MKPGDDMASRIDHTLLKADATEDEIRDLCREAREYGFAAVCVNPVWVNLCRQLLQDTGVMVGTVVGFPLGARPNSGLPEFPHPIKFLVRRTPGRSSFATCSDRRRRR